MIQSFPAIYLLAMIIVLNSPGLIAANPQNEKPADFRVADVFTDHMVLQRDIDVPVWGDAPPGTSVRVAILDYSVTTTADHDGHWIARLAPMSPGGPHSMSVTADNHPPIQFEDLLIGDVWFASGQSNMEWSLRQSENGEAAVAAANWPRIRIITIPKGGNPEPQRYTGTEGWKPVSPQTVGDFSAVAYYFGTNLHQHLEIPIGLIDTSYGGSQMESYMPLKALLQSETFAWAEEAFNQYKQAFNDPEARQAYEEALAEWQRQTTGNSLDLALEHVPDSKGWEEPDFDDSDWETMQIPNKLSAAENMVDFDGAIWFRRTVKIPPNWSGRELQLHLGPIDDYDTTFVNGVKVGATGPEVALAWDVPREYIIPAGLAIPGEAVIAIRLFDKAGEGGFAGSPQQLRLLPKADPAFEIPHADDEISLAGEWKYNVAHEIIDRPSPPGGAERHTPTALFNEMIHPVIPYAIKGVIWYQGESNWPRAEQYAELSQTMINTWRELWNQGEFPFLTCQLSSYGAGGNEWPTLREAQAQTLELPNTGLVVTIDVGDEVDIHPRDKKTVGERLFLAARAVAYEEDIVHRGPIYESMESHNGKLHLTFSTGGKPLTSTSQNPRGFEIAGENGEFYPAAATIIDHDTVAVWSENVDNPTQIRYGWKDFTDANLYNKAELPAVPFRATLQSKTE